MRSQLGTNDRFVTEATGGDRASMQGERNDAPSPLHPEFVCAKEMHMKTKPGGTLYSAFQSVGGARRNHHDRASL